MNTQFQPCIQHKRTFNVTKDHYTNHKLIVDYYARATNRFTGKKNIRQVQNLEVEEVLYTYDLFVGTCNDLGMPVARWHTQCWQCLEIEHTKEGFKVTVRAYIRIITPDPDAKGTMIAAFKHQHMAKPMDQQKRMFFKTHPRSWQDAYMDTYPFLPPTKSPIFHTTTTTRSLQHATVICPPYTPTIYSIDSSLPPALHIAAALG
eukprot:jgi/Psemu1/2271/gm1.2271_g